MGAVTDMMSYFTDSETEDMSAIQFIQGMQPFLQELKEE